MIDTTATAGSEITPYVDGQAVNVQQDGSGTGQGAFANSTLYLMSRGGGALFGGGSLDQLAIYNQPLSTNSIFQHYFSDGVSEEIRETVARGTDLKVIGRASSFQFRGAEKSKAAQALGATHGVG